MRHEIWFGGNRMGSRDLWTSQGQSYWPNAAPSATDVYGYGFSGHQSDGRSFHAERLLIPDELGDEALLSYLESKASTPAVGDYLNVMLVPRGSIIEGTTIDIKTMPTGLGLQAYLVKLSDNSEVALGAAFTVADNGTRIDPAVPAAPQTEGINHMIALKVTAIPAGGAAVDWTMLNVHLSAVGHDDHSGHPAIDVRLPKVTT